MREYLIVTGDLIIGLIVCLLPVVAVFILMAKLQVLSSRQMGLVVGRRGVITAGFFGVVLHELAHFLMCLVFRYRVTEVKFFQMSSADGTLGYVNFSYNPRSMYQKIGLFFVGMAPFYFGAMYLWLTTYFVLGYDLLGSTGSVLDWSQPLGLLHALSEASFLTAALWWVLVVSIALHMMPSSVDLKGAGVGLAFIASVTVTVLFVIAVVVGDPYAWLGEAERLGWAVAINLMQFALVHFFVLILSSLLNYGKLLIPFISPRRHS